MKTKLTLTVDSEAIAKAKRLAKKRGVSVSALFEKWSARESSSAAHPSLGERYRGRWKEPSEVTDPRVSYLLEKHGPR